MTSFKEAFAAARKAKGAGATFMWNGKSYSTNLKNEGKSSKPSAGAQVARDAMVALGRAEATKPKGSKGSSERARPVAAPERITGAALPKPQPGMKGRGQPATNQARNMDKPGRSASPPSKQNKNPVVRASNAARTSASMKSPKKGK